MPLPLEGKYCKLETHTLIIRFEKEWVNIMKCYVQLSATIMHMEVTALTTSTMVHTLVDMERLVGTLIIQLADIIAVKRFCS